MAIVTVGQFLDNMEKNGYKQAFGSLVMYSDHTIVLKKRKVIAACALGQALLNTPEWADEGPLEAIRHVPNSLYDYITRLNDVRELPIKEIVDMARVRFAAILDSPMLYQK